MFFKHITPGIINQVKPSVLSQVKTEVAMVIKNEPPESEIMEMGVDIRESPDIPDIIDINSLFLKTEKTETISDGCENSGTGQGVIETQGSIEHFDAIGSLEANKQLVLNHSTDLNGISKRSRKTKHCKKTNFTESYKTIVAASWTEDREKIKVINAPMIPVETHEYTSLAKDKHVCNHCQCECISLKNIKRHIKLLHRIVTTMYQCPYCSFMSSRKTTLRLHIIRKHKDTQDIQWFQCHLCERKFKSKSDMTRHTKVHITLDEMQDRLEVCAICGKAFKTETSVKRHMKMVHSKMERKGQDCEDATTKNQQLEHHINNTHKKQRYHCDMCSYETCHGPHLKRHKLNNHLKPEEIQYFYCFHCSYKSKQKDNLQKHIFRHFRDEKVPLYCYICNFVTLQRELFTEHIKKHSKGQIKSEINGGS